MESYELKCSNCNHTVLKGVRKEFIREINGEWHVPFLDIHEGKIGENFSESGMNLSSSTFCQACGCKIGEIIYCCSNREIIQIMNPYVFRSPKNRCPIKFCREENKRENSDFLFGNSDLRSLKGKVKELKMKMIEKEDKSRNSKHCKYGKLFRARNRLGNLIHRNYESLKREMRRKHLENRAGFEEVCGKKELKRAKKLR